MWPKKPQLIQEDKTLEMQSLYILEENHFDLDNIEWVQKNKQKKTQTQNGFKHHEKFSSILVSELVVTSGQRKEKNEYSVK